jgi:hypothetical protein
MDNQTLEALINLLSKEIAKYPNPTHTQKSYLKKIADCYSRLQEEYKEKNNKYFSPSDF